ncbi:MAG: UDP-N-acetylmuramoyl-L-alanine--D-glutamate ligase [Rhodospirillales bacterium]|nr:UDP-N-acetylmuramoyl-L-alanine--D-glutamate ligase [Rhodospirillales bacterium]
MIDVFAFNGYLVAVLGLGRSGLSAARALQESGAEVWAWDDDPAARQRAEELNVPLVDLNSCDWSECTTLVLSPGIPHTYPAPHPIAAKAIAAKVEIICDIELLARSQRLSSYVGITGTNGKSTTTALVGHILSITGRQTEIGGNFGIPALDLEPLGEGDIYVLEMSSYQLERTVSLTFDFAVLLNISADHLERHGGMDGYIAAKKQIFRRQTYPRTAVIGIDDAFCQAICDDLKAAGDQAVVPISGYQRAHGGVYVLNGILIDDMEGQETAVCDLSAIPSLPGVHNWQNAAAAYATTKAIGIQPHAIMACLQSYPGLVHRQEAVEIVDGVAFVNDSKATNADAAARALVCYENIFWIAGGRSKAGGLKSLAPHLGEVRHAFLIGEAALELASFLDGQVPVTLAGDIKTAVNQAYKMARDSGVAKPVVLLSPACASFDQFANFEDRGDAFRELVEALDGRHQDPFEEPGLFPTRKPDVTGEEMVKW